MQDEIMAVLQQELEQSYNAELDGVQALALQYYDAVPGDVPAGWSALVSPDVRDAIESIMAEIGGAINVNEPLASFDPTTENDVKTADLETRAVHNVIFGKNRGYILIESAIRDCLLQRYGVIKCDTYAGTIQLRGVPPENFRWSYDLASPFLEEARFVAEKVYYTRAELRDLGISAGKVDKCSVNPDYSQTEFARKPEQTDDDAARSEDDNIQCWSCYLRNNTKGGYDCYLINENIELKKTHVAFLPYATGVAIIRPHRFDGLSIFDKLQQIQSSKTFMLRQLATNARLANQVRLAIRDRGVNPDDLLSEELNPIIRCTGLPGESLMPLPVQDVTSQMLSTLQWMDGVRRDDGGASIDMNSPQMVVANQSAHAVEREYSFRELQASAILRTLGETLIRSLYLVVHATMRQAVAEVAIKDDATFIFANPTQFPHRTDISIDIGATMGTKLRRQNAIAQMVQQQQLVLQTGGSGLLVNLPDMYRAQIEYAKLAGVPNPERYWTDPESPESQQAAQMQAVAAQQQAQKQEQMAMQAMQVPLQVEQMKSESELIKQHVEGQQDITLEEMRLKQKYFDTVLKSQADGRALDIKEIEVLTGIATDRLNEDEVGEREV